MVIRCGAGSDPGGVIPKDMMFQTRKDFGRLDLDNMASVLAAGPIGSAPGIY